jgi:sialate O-acetylesterase
MNMQLRTAARRRLARLGACSAVLLLAAHASAAVKVAPVFGDHMVLQRDVPVPVWGTADVGEKVTVTAGGQEASVTADGAGKWMVKLPALKSGGGAIEVTVSGAKPDDKVTLKDVLVGEVWVASGQSNMEWTVRNSKDFEQERASADYSQIRMFTVQKAVAAEPRADLKGDWKLTTPENVPNFSAVGYFFARELHMRLNVPVGIIHTSWGGTPAESWTEASAMESSAGLKPIVARWRQQASTYTQRQEQWKQQAEKARAEGKRPPNPPTDPAGDPWRPSGLYNAMVAPRTA